MKTTSEAGLYPQSGGSIVGDHNDTATERTIDGQIGPANEISEKGDNQHNAVDSSSSSAQEPPAKEHKEGGYGWVVVFSVFLINFHTWGMNSAYAVFLAYYLNSDAFPGSNATDFAFVGGLSISIALLFAPVATLTIGKTNTRTCLLIGVFFETAAFIGASFTSKIWHLILSQGIAFGIGMGFLFTGSVGLVPQWFMKRRSFANSIGTAGSGFGGLTYSLAANAMITNLGLEWAFRILAILAFVVNSLSAFLARDRNKEVGAVHQALHKDLFRKKELYLLLAWGFFSILGYIVVVFSLPSYGSAVGFTATQGSVLAAMLNLSQGIGRIAIGYLSDRLGRINVAGLATLIASLAAFFLWIFAGEYFAGAIVYALFGAVAGAIWPCIAPVTVEVMGLQLLPSALSITWLVLVLPATFAEVIGLSLVTPGKNGYLHVQIYTGCMYLAAFVFMWALRVCKLHSMEVEALTKQEREQEIRNADTAETHRPATDRPKLDMGFALKASFSITKL